MFIEHRFIKNHKNLHKLHDTVGFLYYFICTASLYMHTVAYVMWLSHKQLYTSWLNLLITKHNLFLIPLHSTKNIEILILAKYLILYLSIAKKIREKEPLFYQWKIHKWDPGVYGDLYIAHGFISQHIGILKV